ncbi:Chaperone SurA [bioreactor metagenome]|uniref:Chaperone SurA n=1 Tax=bioreactor metagenome TaxID=1076179 RepID=A0A644YF71_9ZZZZ|nr:peptidylprolyl isomerase [Oscillospiraceae bacterium]
MGKGNRNKQLKIKEISIKQKKREEQALKRKKSRKIVIVSVCGILCAAILCTAGVLIANAVLDSGDLLRSKVCLSSENYKVDEAMITFYIYKTYNSYVDSLGADTLKNKYGLDTSVSLKDQYEEDKTTWYDYFRNMSVDSAKEMLVLSEAAREAGVSLSEKELSICDNKAGELDVKKYGRGVNIDDIKRSLKLSSLVSKYLNDINEGIKVSDDDIQSYYTKNKYDYLSFDYRCYSINFSSTGEEGKLTADEAKAKADKLAAVSSVDEFLSSAETLIRENNPGFTDDQVEADLNETLSVKANYDSTDNFKVWAFSDGRNVGETYVSKGTSSYSVYLLVSLPALDESITKNVRHILITAASAGSDSAATALATDILKQFNSGDKTTDSFALLAFEYSEDGGSAAKGGKYTNVYSHQMVDEFDEWCFDPARKSGDTGIIKSNFGYHVMYFEGDGLPKWKADVFDAVSAEKYKEIYEGFEAKYPVK